MLYGEKVEQYLKKNKIKYKIVDGGNYMHNFICFTVYDSAKLPDFPRLIYSKPDVSNEFTQQELLESDYLTIEPIIPAIDVENEHEAYEYKCPKKDIFGKVVFSHKKQVSPYRIKKYNPKGKTTFYTNSVGFRDIFAKKEACNLMQENNITGLQIRSVMSGTRKLKLTIRFANYQQITLFRQIE